MSKEISLNTTNTATYKRGAFILFEGCDRTGKSTQANKLFEYLQSTGHSVKLWKFPDRTTPIGQTINAYLTNNQELDDKAIHLLFSANRWESLPKLKNLLLGGTTLIVDRYAYSGVSYSVAKGLDLDWCRCPDIGLLRPDIIIFMDLSIEESEKRGGFGEERYEKKNFQEKVCKSFSQLKQKDDDDSLWKFLDAKQSVERLHEQIVKISLDLIENCSQLPLKEDLWKKHLG
ncbi:12415_t:CDS:2 [Funneliformis geosporum]|uniref:Thymidylate kinase n=1 Tax=Funneliformis geosporum TaxID=1117311 RepID=A0A9W4SMF3_9GLOM|nr:12415_t:CDS:2 [Funneliformis geosporum]CAI2174780.1 13855_t:CDS:2 [Funneliformis geosporum]